jgi:uroporphyrinogen III methyltransferase/synthase
MPLREVTALVTRAREQAADLREGLAASGARVILTPAIRIADPESWEPMDQALRAGSSYHWIILTSVNGVAAVGRRLRSLGRGWDSLSGTSVAAIGPATASALKGEGLEPSLVPEEYRAEGILDALRGEDLSGKRILLARAEKAREILPEDLRRQGAVVDVVPAYRTLPCAPHPEAVKALSGSPGAGLLVIFTSPSTVTHFLDALPAAALRGVRSATVAAIGPVTAATLGRRGLEPAIQPERYTVPSLLDAIRDHFTGG